MLDIRANDRGVTFKVVVQPRASKAAIVGRHQEALKIKLTAPPVDNAANKQCITVLAKTLGRPKSTIEIISGQTSRQKQIHIRPKQDSMPSDEQSELVEKLTLLGSKSEKKTP